MKITSFQTIPFRIIVAGTPETRILYFSGKMTSAVSKQVADQLYEVEALLFTPESPIPRIIMELQGIDEFDGAGVQQFNLLLSIWREAKADLFFVARSESLQSATGARFANELLKAGAFAIYYPAASLQTVLKLATFRGASFKKIA